MGRPGFTRKEEGLEKANQKGKEERQGRGEGPREGASRTMMSHMSRFSWKDPPAGGLESFSQNVPECFFTAERDPPGVQA